MLETIVFGKRAGEAARRYAAERGPGRPDERQLERAQEDAKARLYRLLEGPGKASLADVRRDMAQVMTEKVGIFREKGAMAEAAGRIGDLKKQSRLGRVHHHGSCYNLELMRAVELEGMLEVAEVIARGALLREESRGSHFRRDFPQRDDANWLQHTIATYTPDGPRFSAEPVQITRWQPEARKY